jgi:hypothetical protein
VVRGEGNDGITELQKRLERKADVDTVEQLLRGSTKTKEVISASFHGWLDMCVYWVGPFKCDFAHSCLDCRDLRL